MRRLPYLGSGRSKGPDRYGSRRVRQVKCCGKTKGAMFIRRIFVLVGRRRGAAVSRMLAKFR
jgi:hypothetical protein